MNRERITKDWLFNLCMTITEKPLMDQTPIHFEDCTIYTLRSIELSRTYSCFHVVGSDVNFILKESDRNEIEVYRNLNNKRVTPRLSVPRMYEFVELFNRETRKSIYFIALEHIAVNEGMGLTDCSDQVDGIIMYKEGRSGEAWSSAGYELARIHLSFWNVAPLDSIPYCGIDYESLMQQIENSQRIKSDNKLMAAIDIMKKRLDQMPWCLQNLDLFPINVLVKERAYSAGGERTIRPHAYFVDWKNAKPGPYILDLARMISHCHRECVSNPDELYLSPAYCSEDCRNAIVNSYANEIMIQHKNISDFQLDLLSGQLFEIARMYIQMPTPYLINSYDRYYYHNMFALAGMILSEKTDNNSSI